MAKIWCADIANALEFSEIPKIFGRFAPEKKSGTVPWRPGQGELIVLGRSLDGGTQQFSVLAKGSGQQVLGHEATVVICDDPTDARIAKSVAQNQDQMEWFMEQVLSRIENASYAGGAAGRAVIVGQRVHYQDMYGQIADQVWERGPLMGQSLWTVITMKAILDWPGANPDYPDGRVLWPEKWNFDELMLQMARVGGSRPFECMFQQNPLPDEAKIVNPAWWDRCKDWDRAWGIPIGLYSNDQTTFSRVISLDPSPSMYNGLVIADVLYDRTRFYAVVLESKSFKGGMRDILSTLQEAITTYRPDYCIIEFSTFVDWLREDPIYEALSRMTKIIPHSTGRNKGDPELGLESLGYDVESGNIRLPYADAESAKISQGLQHEFDTWVRDGRNIDDQMLALWFIKWNWKRFVPRRMFKGQGNARSNVPARLKNGFAWAKRR